MPAPSPHCDPNEPSFRLPENLLEEDNRKFEQDAWRELTARSQERGVRLPHSGIPEDWKRFMREFWERGGSDSDGQLLDFFSKYLGAHTPWHRDFSDPPREKGKEFGPSGRPRPLPFRPRERLFCPDPMS